MRAPPAHTQRARWLRGVSHTLGSRPRRRLARRQTSARKKRTTQVRFRHQGERERPHLYTFLVAAAATNSYAAHAPSSLHIEHCSADRGKLRFLPFHQHRNLPNSSKTVLIQTTTSAARSHGSGAASGDDWAAQDCCPRRWPPATDAARQHGPAAEQVHHACGQPGPGELERLGDGDTARWQRDAHRGAARTVA